MAVCSLGRDELRLDFMNLDAKANESQDVFASLKSHLPLSLGIMSVLVKLLDAPTAGTLIHFDPTSPDGLMGGQILTNWDAQNAGFPKNLLEIKSKFEGGKYTSVTGK